MLLGGFRGVCGFRVQGLLVQGILCGPRPVSELCRICSVMFRSVQAVALPFEDWLRERFP